MRSNMCRSSKFSIPMWMGVDGDWEGSMAVLGTTLCCAAHQHSAAFDRLRRL